MADLAPRTDLDQLRHFRVVLVGQLGDVHQSMKTVADLHEAAELDDLDHLAGDHFAGFDLREALVASFLGACSQLFAGGDAVEDEAVGLGAGLDDLDLELGVDKLLDACAANAELAVGHEAVAARGTHVQTGDTAATVLGETSRIDGGQLA